MAGECVIHTAHVQPFLRSVASAEERASDGFLLTNPIYNSAKQTKYFSEFSLVPDHPRRHLSLKILLNWRPPDHFNFLCFGICVSLSLKNRKRVTKEERHPCHQTSYFVVRMKCSSVYVFVDQLVDPTFSWKTSWNERKTGLSVSPFHPETHATLHTNRRKICSLFLQQNGTSEMIN